MSDQTTAPIDLERTLRLMDVADDIRRRKRRVEEHLQQSDREKIKEGLAQRYREMGEEVDPELLEEAIEIVLGRQYRFQPPKPGLGLSLAKAYVRRGELTRKVGIPVVLGGLLLGLAWAATQGIDSLRRSGETRKAAAVQKVAEDGKSTYARIVDMAKDPAAIDQAETYRDELERHTAAGNQAGAREAFDSLEDLYVRLNREFTLIITKGRERDNVRYYLIVQAIDSRSRPLTMKIRNEETGKVEEVQEWGERVAKPVYDEVGRDYAADNVIDDNVFGRKVRGYLEPERRHENLGQITRY